jgi:hypothetical protein
MTSARDAPRGKGDVNIGISKVPDPRLDVLTKMYNPRKRVPATVEFTDLIAAARTGAQALVDVAGYKNADALVHVVRAFRDPAVPHPSGSIDPARDAQAMEDELLLADLGVAERRSSASRKISRRASPRSSNASAIWCSAARTRSRKASRFARSSCRRRSQAAERVSIPLGEAAAPRHQPRRSRRRRRGLEHRQSRLKDGPDGFLAHAATRAVACARRSNWKSHSSTQTMRPRSCPIWDSRNPASIA